MASVAMVDMSNKKVKDVELPNLFGAEVKSHLLHSAVVNQLANRRAGTAATKTKGLVSGGGKKPFKQKGTGRARAGSTRSPLWRHGGTVFGPTPRDYSYSMPKKEKRAALAAALSSKVSDNRMVLLDKLELAGPRTKQMAELLKALGVTESALVLITAENKNVALASRNIPSIKVLRMENINVYDLLKYRYLITTQDALTTMQEVYGK
ncbi:MAG: 50S ribosomal protein L4 [Nitrospirae bacterium]|jgi:large subunit ribosomal protein L4|nr:50S ribosomal protein L4 [Nitrospirota bacterium]NTW66652.1 50S ribosomal protein L4 [Nitrospirota bacterium]